MWNEAGGGREPARVFDAHDEVAGVVVYIGSWWSDGHGAQRVAFVVAAVAYEGRGVTAAFGVGGRHVVERRSGPRGHKGRTTRQGTSAYNYL